MNIEHLPDGEKKVQLYCRKCGWREVVDKEETPEEHDAIIRNQTLDDVLKTAIEIEKTGECPYGWYPLGRECDDQCTICVIEKAVESLRTKEQAP